MDNPLQRYIDAFEEFSTEKNEVIELLLIGGLAMSVYGIPRYTIDIDAEINCSDKAYYELIDYLKAKDIAFNLSENIAGWGIVPLPEGYRERAAIAYKGKQLVLKVLEPVDFIFSKLLRGTEQDFTDAIEVIKKYNLTSDMIKKRESLIKYPKDSETLFFKKKLQHLFELLERN